jgi:hypothetical protein
MSDKISVIHGSNVVGFDREPSINYEVNNNSIVLVSHRTKSDGIITPYTSSLEKS